MDKHLFPLNYTYKAKFLGLIEYQILLPICIICAIIIFVLYMLRVDFFLGFGIVILFALPSTLILSVGVNGQPAIPYFTAMYKYNKSRKVYVYKK